MVRLAYTLLASNAEAEEIVQDSFVEVHRRWPEIQKPGAYLRCTVVSRCRSALQRRKLRSPYPVAEPSVSASAGELWDVLTRLSDEQRIAVVLRYYGGYSASDIAAYARCAGHDRALTPPAGAGDTQEGARGMSKLTDRLERDLREIAAGAHPSPSARESIVARLDDAGESGSNRAPSLSQQVEAPQPGSRPPPRPSS